MEKEGFMRNWVKRGLLRGAVMFLALVVAIPLLNGDQLEVSVVLLGLVVFLVMGLVYGYVIHKVEK